MNAVLCGRGLRVAVWNQRLRCQRGQAIAEFVVAVSVLALLLMGLPAIQRYHQLQFAGIGAARALAWLGELPGEPAASANAGATAADRERQGLYARWLPDAGAGDDAGIAQLDSLQPATSDARLPGLAGAASQALLLPFQLLSLLGSGADLKAEGLRSAQVSLNVSSPDSLPAPFAGLALELVERHAVLADGWGASGPAQAAARAGGLVPTAALAAVRPLLDVGTAVLSVLEPSLRQLCLGQVNAEVVPVDRLTTGSSSTPATRWVPPC
jgi:hypothetical protein